jgi:hypothetical protein
MFGIDFSLGRPGGKGGFKVAHNESFAESVENEAANVTLSGVKAGFRKGVVLSRGGVQSSTDPGIGMTRQIIESAKKIRLGIPQDRWGRLESVKVDEGEARAIDCCSIR